MAWLTGWRKRVSITIDYTKFSSTNQTAFPLLIKLSTSCGVNSFDATSIFDEITYKYLKLAVTQSDGTTQCYVEVDRWDSANKIAYLWVNTNIASGTVLYLYYDRFQDDNSNYVGIVLSTAAKNAWNSNFAAVYHFESRIYELDSTIQCNADNYYNAPQKATGVFGNGRSYNGSTDRSAIPHSSYINFTTALTIETWVNPVSVQTTYRVIMCKAAASGNYRLWQLETMSNGTKVLQGQIRKTSADACVIAGGAYAWNAGTWYHIALTYDKTASELKFFVNGAQSGSTVTWNENIPTSTAYCALGCGWWASGWTDYANVILDETRFSNVARTPSWILGTYNCSIDTVNTFGSVEINPTSPIPPPTRYLDTATDTETIVPTKSYVVPTVTDTATDTETIVATKSYYKDIVPNASDVITDTETVVSTKTLPPLPDTIEAITAAENAETTITPTNTYVPPSITEPITAADGSNITITPTPDAQPTKVDSAASTENLTTTLQMATISTGGVSNIVFSDSIAGVVGSDIHYVTLHNIGNAPANVTINSVHSNVKIYPSTVTLAPDESTQISIYPYPYAIGDNKDLILITMPTGYGTSITSYCKGLSANDCVVPIFPVDDSIAEIDTAISFYTNDSLGVYHYKLQVFINDTQVIRNSVFVSGWSGNINYSNSNFTVTINNPPGKFEYSNNIKVDVYTTNYANKKGLTTWEFTTKTIGEDVWDSTADFSNNIRNNPQPEYIGEIGSNRFNVTSITSQNIKLSGSGASSIPFTIMEDTFDSTTQTLFPIVGNDGWFGVNVASSDMYKCDINITNPDKLTFDFIGSQDTWNATFDAPFVYRPVTGDFDIETCIGYQNSARSYECAGIMMRDVVSSGGQNWLRLLSGYDVQANRVDWHSTTNSTSTTPYSVTQGAFNKYLRVTRVGNVFTYYSKVNVGDAWSQKGTQTRTMNTALMVGLYAHPSSSSTAGTYIVQFDYFKYNGTTYNFNVASQTNFKVQQRLYGWSMDNGGNSRAFDINTTSTGKLYARSHAFAVDCWDTTFSSPFAYKSIYGDFDVETYISGGNPARNSEMGFILVKSPGATLNHLRMLYGYTGGALCNAFHTCVSGSSSGNSSTSNVGGYLRVTRVGNVFTGYSKVNAGDSWTQRGQFTRDDFSPVLQVGLGYSSTTTSNTYYVEFDYFKINSGIVSAENPFLITSQSAALGDTGIGWLSTIDHVYYAPKITYTKSVYFSSVDWDVNSPDFKFQVACRETDSNTLSDWSFVGYDGTSSTFFDSTHKVLTSGALYGKYFIIKAVVNVPQKETRTTQIALRELYRLRLFIYCFWKASFDMYHKKVVKQIKVEKLNLLPDVTYRCNVRVAPNFTALESASWSDWLPTTNMKDYVIFDATGLYLLCNVYEIRVECATATNIVQDTDFEDLISTDTLEYQTIVSETEWGGRLTDVSWSTALSEIDWGDVMSWLTIHEVDLTSAEDYSVPSLNGTLDKYYMILLNGTLTANSATHMIGIRPNGDTTANNYSKPAEFTLYRDGSSFSHDNGWYGGTEAMLPLGRNSWTSSGVVFCQAMLLATAGTIRCLNTTWVFDRSGYSDKSINGKAHGAWRDTSSAINSLTIYFDGATNFVGNLKVLAMR